MSMDDSQENSVPLDYGILDILKDLDTYRDGTHEGDHKVNLPADVYDRIHFSHQY